MKPRVCLVVLNWNKPDDTLECLESCLATRYPAAETLLVDNASGDDSVARVRARFPGLTVLTNASNLGYAGGNNVGIRAALERGADYVFLLNNDVTIEPDCVEKLVEAAALFPDNGFLAPKVLFYDDRTRVNSMGTRMDWLRLRPLRGEYGQLDPGPQAGILERPILLGAALFIPRATLEQLGLIDEKFFIFHEEADWCLRAWRAGLRNRTVASAAVYHKESRTMRAFSVLTHYYSSRNFLYFAKKNAAPLDWCKTRVGLLYLTLKHAVMAVRPSGRAMARAYFAGLADYFMGRMGKCQRNF